MARYARRRKRYSQASNPPGYTGRARKPTRAPRRRRYGKKKYGGNSKKKILNMTSRKKRNGMLSWSNTTATGANRAMTQGPAIVANTGAFFVFAPTMQQLDAQSTIPNQASRTATTCYMRGLSEHLRIQTSSGIPWFHRRICFTLKGINPFQTVSSLDTPGQPYNPYLDTTNGIERPWMNTQINNMTNTQQSMWGLLFKGTVGKDWDDLIIAPVDSSRVGIKFDKTWCIQSGNANGVVRERKLWHSMNKNVVYDDDENGDSEYGSYYSVDSKAGMGDYYVVDVIQPGTGATSSDLLQIGANSTMYWHEK